MTEFHRMGSLSNKKLLLWFWGPKVQDQGARELGFILRPLPLASSCFCAHMISSLCGQKEGEQALLYLLYLYKHQSCHEGSTFMTSSNPHYLLKAPSPNTITWGLKSPIYELSGWGEHRHSIRNISSVKILLVHVWWWWSVVRKIGEKITVIIQQVFIKL